MATAKKQSSARPTRSAAAAEAADAAAVLAVGVDPDRPLTRRSAAQQVTTPSTAGPSAAAAAAAGTSILRASSRSKNSCNPVPSSAQDEGRLQPLPNVETAAKTQGLSAKRKRVNEEVALAVPTAEGDF